MQISVFDVETRLVIRTGYTVPNEIWANLQCGEGEGWVSGHFPANRLVYVDDVGCARYYDDGEPVFPAIPEVTE